MLAPWIGGGGRVLIFLLPRLLLFSVVDDDLLGAFRVVDDDETPIGQGYAALCPRVGAETGAADLVRLGEVGDVISLWV